MDKNYDIRSILTLKILLDYKGEFLSYERIQAEGMKRLQASEGQLTYKIIARSLDIMEKVGIPLESRYFKENKSVIRQVRWT